MQVTLRAFGRDDFDRLISWVGTPEALARWCAAFFTFPLDHTQLDRYLESTGKPNVREAFAALTEAGEVVGHVEVSMIWPHLSCRLSRVLVAPHARRRGIGSRMVGQAIIHAFTEHHADRIDLGVVAENTAAIACYEGQGFARVGIWPNAMTAAGQSIDVCWMTLTRAKWSARSQD